VQIIIDNKTHVFDIKKSREGIVPVFQKTYSSEPHSISEVPTEIKIAEVQKFSPQLLSALAKYQEVVKNTPKPESYKEMQAAQQLAVAQQSAVTQQRLYAIGQNLQRLNAEVAGQTFNLNEISPSILHNASPTDQRAVAYAFAQLLKNNGQQAFVSRESELEVAKINDTGQVTIYAHRLSTDTTQNILEAAQQLQQEQTRQASRSNRRNFEIGG
jgi:hypothetical protein